jgi:hypothetical protein
MKYLDASFLERRGYQGPVSTYFFSIKVQRVLIGATRLIYDCRYLNLVRWDSRSIEIRQRDCHAFGNSKDRIVTHKYFTAGEEIFMSNLTKGLSLVIDLRSSYALDREKLKCGWVLARNNYLRPQFTTVCLGIVLP